MAALDFNWTAINPGYPGVQVMFRVGITPVARLTDRLGGSWFARLDIHLEGGEHTRDCTSYEAGRRGVELWAERHADRLRAEVQAKHDAWMARQHWRPRE